jgi:hypothetical protein
MGYYMEEKARRNAALIAALHGIEESEEPQEPEGPPNFDGGVREPAPVPSDPEQEHNELVLDFLQAKQMEGGPGW